MTLQKFRSGEEMNAAPVITTLEEDAFERFIRHCARIRELARPCYPRGVFRFRTIEEAQAARAEVAKASLDGRSRPGGACMADTNGGSR